MISSLVFAAAIVLVSQVIMKGNRDMMSVGKAIGVLALVYFILSIFAPPATLLGFQFGIGSGLGAGAVEGMCIQCGCQDCACDAVKPDPFTEFPTGYDGPYKSAPAETLPSPY